MITGDLQRVYEDYPGEEPDDMERRMKIGFSMFSKLTIDNLRSLGIPEHWAPDIKSRLYFQGFNVRYKDRNGKVVVISRKSQLKLQRQGY